MSRSMAVRKRSSPRGWFQGLTLRMPSIMPPGPPGPLAGEMDQPGRGGGKGDRRRLVVDARPLAHELPGQDDVLADGVGPAPGFGHRLGPVEAEGALGDQGPLIEALHSLHRRDPEEVVPFLHPGPEAVAAVA